MSELLTVRIFGRSRKLQEYGAYQHRLSTFTTLLAMLPPAIFFGVYYLITSEGSRRIVQVNPALEELVRRQDRIENLLILAALFFYGLGVYLVSLMESHRTAGFLWRLNQCLQELRDGRYGGSIHPRHDDDFVHVAEMTNALSRNLKTRVDEDLTLLNDIGESLDQRAASAGEGSPRRELLLELRGRVEAMRALKRSCLADDVPAVPAAIPEVYDTSPPGGDKTSAVVPDSLTR